jgi:hypothetical protein
MGTFEAKLRRYSSGAGKWYPRKITRHSDKQAFEIYHIHDAISGIIYINKASVVGCGSGSGVTITDTTSTITVTE